MILAVKDVTFIPLGTKEALFAKFGALHHRIVRYLKSDPSNQLALITYRHGSNAVAKALEQIAKSYRGRITVYAFNPDPLISEELAATVHNLVSCREASRVAANFADRYPSKEACHYQVLRSSSCRYQTL